MTPCHTGYKEKNGAALKVNMRFISRLTWAQRTPSVAANIQVSHGLPAIRFSCILRGRGASFQDGVVAGNGFLCAHRKPFPAVTQVWKLALRPHSKHEKRTNGSA
jgi:hypothetical protein